MLQNLSDEAVLKVSRRLPKVKLPIARLPQNLMVPSEALQNLEVNYSA